VNLIRNGWSTSIPAAYAVGNTSNVRRQIFGGARLSRAKNRRYISSRDDCTETGPLTVESRIMAGELPYSMRRLLSSQVFRALSQMLAWQLIGE
jgi:hypothetical protein